MATRNSGPTSKIERELAGGGASVVVGLDEVGRGAWAGPVTVGAALWRPGSPLRGVRDSKELTPQQREDVYSRLVDRVPHGIGHAWPSEIDDLGMTAALRLASLRALAELHGVVGLLPDIVLLDGQLDFLGGVVPVRCIVGGDRRCVSVATASILAKVTRDRLMAELGERHPVYLFSSNKGYPAPPHRAALAEHGPCTLHRRTWAPIREVMGLDPYVRCAGGADEVPLQAALF